jgi:hypothetical protein
LYTSCTPIEVSRGLQRDRKGLSGLEMVGCSGQVVVFVIDGIAFGMQGSLVQIQSSRPEFLKEIRKMGRGAAS